MITPKDYIRFWSKVDKGGPGDCWLWKAGTFVNGYGQMMASGKNQRAHRLSYEIESGPIPGGKLVLHNRHCTSRRCVNPSHLYLGTPQQNADDTVAMGRVRWRAHRGETNPFAKLTEADVRTIRAIYKPRVVTIRMLTERFKVGRTTICRILARQKWRHVA